MTRAELSEVLETPSGKNAGGENFPVGSWLIRPDLRRHVHVFYNFARAADDIADNPLLEASDKVSRLDRFAAILQGDDGDAPTAQAMREDLRETGVSPRHCLDLLAAFRRDATQLRYRDWDDLLDYCRYSASPVGRHVLALHGIGEGAWPANDALCSALQVINHIQDCADDYAELDRVYLPQDMLAAHGANIAQLSAARSSPALRATLNDMLDKLGPLLDLAHTFPRQVPDLRLKLEVSVIAALAERLVKLLRSRDPLCQEVKLGACGTAFAALKGVGRAWL